MGDDPSSTEGEAFGIRLLHDRYIAERLVHKDMSQEGQKELLQCMGDSFGWVKNEVSINVRTWY
eukprot:12138503-Ditylum_brightwellii.AAC.1